MSFMTFLRATLVSRAYTAVTFPFRHLSLSHCQSRNLIVVCQLFLLSASFMDGDLALFWEDKKCRNCFISRRAKFPNDPFQTKISIFQPKILADLFQSFHGSVSGRTLKNALTINNTTIL